MSFLGILIVMMGLNTPDYTEIVKSRNHKWLMSPVVRVCVDSGVTPPRISNALAYWQRLGYKFDYTRIDHTVPCPDARFGEIIIVLPDKLCFLHLQNTTQSYTLNQKSRMTLNF